MVTRDLLLMCVDLVLELKYILILMLFFLGYGDKLKDKDSVEVGTADYNRKYYLQRHLLAMNEAIW